MARKRRYRRRKEVEKSPAVAGISLDLKPETSRAIIAVVLFAFAVISTLSLFDAAGSFGSFWKSGVATLLGIAVYIMPLLFIALALAVLNLKKFPTKGATYLGFILFVISFVGLAHLSLDQVDAFSQAEVGRGGGLVGYVIGYPLFSFFGFWASLIILGALIIIALLLFFNHAVEGLVDKVRGVEPEGEKAKIAPNVVINGKVDEAASKGKMRILDFNKKTGQLAQPTKDNKAKDFGPPIETSKSADSNWQFPPFTLLDDTLDRPSSGNIKENATIIQQTLQNFGIAVEMGDVSVGPTVTQFTLRPDAGVKLTRIVALQNDLSLALAAHPIRIEAPIPGKSVVGVEVPNVSIATVRIRELLDSKEAKKTPGQLVFPLGRDVAGSPIMANIEKMPHLLIAGATGSGKSVAINAMLISLLYRNSPSDLKLILVDPKRVELTSYNDIPHLLTPVITDVKKTINSLKWIVAEMDRRYKLLQAHGSRNIQSFNANKGDSHLPRIVVVIDELADLMSVAARDVEASIVRLAQMARAVGIHLVVATQRPSVDVITGLIKANIPSRIAFSVASLVDSRTILDTSGAEKLLGNGDMLYIASDLGKPKRVQGAFVSDKEVEKVTDFLKDKQQPEYIEEVTAKQGNMAGGAAGGEGDVDDDLYEDAKNVVIEARKASASLLQRRLRVGYARAARLIDLLEQHGIVGPGEGAKPRDILVGRADVGDEVDVDDSQGFNIPKDDTINEASSDEPEPQEDTYGEEDRDEESK